MKINVMIVVLTSLLRHDGVYNYCINGIPRTGVLLVRPSQQSSTSAPK